MSALRPHNGLRTVIPSVTFQPLSEFKSSPLRWAALIGGQHRRREFIAGIGAAAASSLPWPRTVHAQQPTPVIGYLGSASPDAWAGRLKAFRQGLSEAGFAEGGVTIEYRGAEKHYDRLAELAADLVRREVAVIVVPGSAAGALAAKAATTKIPIVFETGADPLEIGLVPSLNHPGGNVTGVSQLSFEFGPKRLEFLHEGLPATKTVAVLSKTTAGGAPIPARRSPATLFSGRERKTRTLAW